MGHWEESVGNVWHPWRRGLVPVLGTWREQSVRVHREASVESVLVGLGQARWCAPVTQLLGRLRQEHNRFRARLRNLVRP